MIRRVGEVWGDREEEDDMGEWGSGGHTILIADGDPDFRRAAAEMLETTGLLVREATTGHEALDAAEDESIALVVLEVRFDDLSGYEVCRRLRDVRGDALPILFVSQDRTEVFDCVAGLLVGADDYLTKPVSPDELSARVRRHLQRVAASAAAPESVLTAREREVLALLAEGFGPVEIGSELSISPKTVATHVEHIYAKLGVHTRAQAVAKAFRLSLVSATA
jgi:DNA-binding NarL/FixJ family response regulator